MYKTTFTSLQLIFAYLFSSFSLLKEKNFYLNLVILRDRTQNNICLTKAFDAVYFFITNLMKFSKNKKQ